MYSDYDTMRTMLRLAHSPRTFSPTRTLFVDGLVTLATTLGAINRVGERLDDLFYGDYRKQSLGKPIYIVAAPRSGTTFLHRMMSLDPQFTSLKLYETFFPTVSGHKLASRVATANGRLGAFLTQLRARLDDNYFGAWEGLHDTGLSQEEEDEALWHWPSRRPPSGCSALPGRVRAPAESWTLPSPSAQAGGVLPPGFSSGTVQLGRPDLDGQNCPLAGASRSSRGGARRGLLHVLRPPYEGCPPPTPAVHHPGQWHSPTSSQTVPMVLGGLAKPHEYYPPLPAKNW